MAQINSNFNKQRGAVSIFMAIALVVLILCVGFAIDMGHAYINKTKVQGIVDALALAGAQRLEETGDVVQTKDTIHELLALNLSTMGNEKLNDRISEENLIVEFSETLHPFVPGAIFPQYLRIRFSPFELQNWFVKVVGVNDTLIAARAVAGPSPSTTNQICEGVPIVACGDPQDDPSINGGNSFWGYQPNKIQLLKTTMDEEVNGCDGPGNVKIINHEGSAQITNFRHLMAGNFEGCLNTSIPVTSPSGDFIQAISDGLNTRLGEYTADLGSDKDLYPPDVVTLHADEDIALEPGQCASDTIDQIQQNWDAYKDHIFTQNFDHPPPQGIYSRRVIRVPVADCSDSADESNVPLLGTACFFILKMAESTEDENVIYTQFIDNCTQDAVVGKNPDNGYGPYKIVLYEDIDSYDS